MKLINRGSKQSPIARQACDAALAEHVARFGEFGRRATVSTYTVQVEGGKGGGRGDEPAHQLCGNGTMRCAPIKAIARTESLRRKHGTI